MKVQTTLGNLHLKMPVFESKLKGDSLPMASTPAKLRSLEMSNPEKVISHASTRASSLESSPQNIKDQGEIDTNKLYALNKFCHILDEFCSSGSKNPLERHTISLFHRRKLIDWLLEVKKNFKLSNNTWYLACNILDKFLEKTQIKQSPDALYLLGITSIFIASKQEDVYPINLQTIYANVGHKNFSAQKIKDKEFEILETIDFELIIPSLHDFTGLLLNLMDIQNKLDEFLLHLLRNMVDMVSKYTLMDYTLLKQHNLALIGCGVISLCFKMLEKMHPGFIFHDNIITLMDLVPFKQSEVSQITTKILEILKNETMFKEIPHLMLKKKKIDALQNEWFILKENKEIDEENREISNTQNAKIIHFQKKFDNVVIH